MNLHSNGNAAGTASAQFPGARNGAAFVFFALLMLLGLTGLAGLAVSLFSGEIGKQESNFGGAVICALVAWIGYRKTRDARWTLRSLRPAVHHDAGTDSAAIGPPAATTRRTFRWLFWLVLVFGVGIHPVWYWQYRMSMHREAPAFFETFLIALTARWALDDISPFFSERLLESSSRESWESRSLCYAQLGRIKSHGHPQTSDSPVFTGASFYTIPGSFENGEATISVQINKIRGRIRVQQLVVSVGDSKLLKDHPSCRSFRRLQQ